MNYYELSFTYTSPIEKEIINDVLAAELGEIGFESFYGKREGFAGIYIRGFIRQKDIG